MTASTIQHQPAATPVQFGRLFGLRPLIRKDITEWVRGYRAWIVAVITTLFAVLTAANSRIVATIQELDTTGQISEVPISLAPMDNLLASITAQMFVLAAIFAVASLIVRERESGTLAWVASKPVSRSSIWVSKWISSSAILIVAAVLVPLAITLVVVVVLYGAPDWTAVAVMAFGMSAALVFYAALGLFAGTIWPAQAAIIATGFAVFALAPLVVSLVPFPIGPFLPTSILEWSVATAMGAQAGFVTPIAWLVATAGLAALSVRRMGRMEL